MITSIAGTPISADTVSDVCIVLNVGSHPYLIDTESARNLATQLQQTVQDIEGSRDGTHKNERHLHTGVSL